MDVAGIWIQIAQSFSGWIYWLGYGLLITLMLAGMVGIFLLLGYNKKAIIMERTGTGSQNNETHNIGRIRFDRLKEFKKDGVPMWIFLRSREVIKPVNYEHIYSGNRLFLYKTAPGTYFPFKYTVNSQEASFEPVPNDIQFWTMQRAKKVAQDYNKQSAWERYGNVIVMSGTVLFCLILVGVTVYYTYEHANGVTNALGGLTSAIKNNAVVSGVGPH